MSRNIQAVYFLIETRYSLPNLLISVACCLHIGEQKRSFLPMLLCLPHILHVLIICAFSSKLLIFTLILLSLVQQAAEPPETSQLADREKMKPIVEQTLRGLPG